MFLFLSIYPPFNANRPMQIYTMRSYRCRCPRRGTFTLSATESPRESSIMVLLLLLLVCLITVSRSAYVVFVCGAGNTSGMAIEWDGRIAMNASVLYKISQGMGWGRLLVVGKAESLKQRLQIRIEIVLHFNYSSTTGYTAPFLSYRSWPLVGCCPGDRCGVRSISETLRVLKP